MKKSLILIILAIVTITVHAQSDRQYIRNGNKLYKQQNYAKAEAEYRKSLDDNPNNPQAMYNLGCALMMQQKDSAAIAAYLKAAEVEKSKLRKAKAYHNAGVVFQQHNDYSHAAEAYKESLRNNPNDNETRYNLALCLRQQKQNPQNDGKKNQDKKDDKNKKDKDKQQNKDQKQDNKQQKQEEWMSKDNAEQLLNAAMQAEKDTKQKVDEAMRRQNSRKLQKNW